MQHHGSTDAEALGDQAADRGGRARHVDRAGNFAPNLKTATADLLGSDEVRDVRPGQPRIRAGHEETHA
jgi:hypothetical protein